MLMDIQKRLGMIPTIFAPLRSPFTARFLLLA
jgi:hypothetical protein